MTENEELAQILEEHKPEIRPNIGLSQGSPPSSPNRGQDLDLCQWQVAPNGVFRPAAKTTAHLEAGAYFTGRDEYGPYLKNQPLMSDEIIELPESPNIRVLRSIQKFWTSWQRYYEHGLLFKRGILLWGPPGSGKTVGIHLLTRDLIANNGIVVFCSVPELMAVLLSSIRRIEPQRPLIIVLEDIDEIIDRHGEHEILALLDGENQTDNVVYVATTNYPGKLGARILNRPSRFDERIKIDMPSSRSRRAYLQNVSRNGTLLSDETIHCWTRDTEGFSIAHLRELVAAVLCLDQEYPEVLDRLKAMNRKPKEKDGFSSDLGFTKL